MNVSVIGTRLLFAGVMASFIAASVTSVAADAYMDSDRKTMKQVKKLMRSNQIPTAMSCANADKAGKFLKPVVSFKTVPNKDNRGWVVLAYKGQLDFKPVIRDSSQPFSKKYSKTLTARSAGRAFHCSLWIGPKGSNRDKLVKGFTAYTSGTRTTLK
ncbi:hypothetical protein FDK21_05745 [Cohaesibacter sp. CAU 1516]|uniref:hypothetical protein n=1 Tax=Cohaesibacter sp. CAU 1516 TaxID=2576038 RepID=UPI0010FEAF85|nr:hypothetical protein [Cohaesibacter sp. CAU 1516]TLP49128.1 hypothetical protein FDK21_05745 [Cohaesibacter sp. CAU 1516]